jgi:peptidoglycan/xylan/chitin deacetylase (PgdA/CDA1 family)
MKEHADQPHIVRGILKRAARFLRSKPLVMRNATALVSFTFDDVPETAFTNGAAILEQYGVRGTFYIAAGTCGKAEADWRVISRDQIRALHRHCHEIGCHTFSHARVDMLDSESMEEECRRNANSLRDLCPDLRLTNFCYPYGQVTLPRKLQLQQRFDSCRGCFEGINSGVVDLGLLSVIELYDRKLNGQQVVRLIHEAHERKGWLIFYTHDVAETPSWIGCSRRMLRFAVETALHAKIPCLPVRDALTAVGYSRPSVNRAAGTLEPTISDATT